MLTEAKLVHSRNASLQMHTSESGRTTEVRLLHPRNALPPMIFNESGRITEVRLLHPRNALCSMVFNEFGRITVVRLLRRENLPPSINVGESEEGRASRNMRHIQRRRKFSNGDPSPKSNEVFGAFDHSLWIDKVGRKEPPSQGVNL